MQSVYAQAMCGLTHVTVAALRCSCSLLCVSNSDWATENEAGWSVSVNGNEETAGENCHRYGSVVTAIILYLCTIKLQYTGLGDYWECVCVGPARLPVLIWVPSSVPPGTISKIRSSSGAHRISPLRLPIKHLKNVLKYITRDPSKNLRLAWEDPSLLWCDIALLV